MTTQTSRLKEYGLAVGASIVLGGIAVAVATRAFPTLASRLMETMATRMEDGDCPMPEMCRRMFSSHGEARHTDASVSS